MGAARDYFFDVWWRQAFTALVYGAFPIDRARGAKGAVDKARELLAEGWSIVVFPEGTRSADGHLQRFRHGAARLALETGAGLAPIAIVGAFQAMPKGRFWPRSGRPPVTVRYGEPFWPKEGETHQDLSRRMTQAVTQLFHEERTTWWEALQRAQRGETPSLVRSRRPRLAPAVGGLAPGRAHGPREGLGLAPCRGRAARSGGPPSSRRRYGSSGARATRARASTTSHGAVGVRKQTLLYYFSSKDALLEACLHAAGIRLAEVIAQALEGKEGYWERAEAVIHAVFGLASEWPEFPMFVREAGRLGPLAFERFADVLDPLRRRAVEFLQSGMDDGQVRKQDPAMLLFTLYTAVVGSLTEASVLNAVVGADKSRASLRRREKEVVAFVRAALEPAPDR